MPAENRRALSIVKLVLQTLLDEGDPGKVDWISRGGNHMGAIDLRFTGVGLAERQPYSLIDDSSACNRCAQVHGQTADDLVADEPNGRRTEMTPHPAKAQRLRYRVKYQRGVGTHARAPAGTEARARSLQRLNQGTGFNGRGVKVNGTSAREKLDLCPGLEKQRSQVDGG